MSDTPLEVHLFKPGSNAAEPDEDLRGAYRTVDEVSSGTRCLGVLRSKESKTTVEFCDVYNCSEARGVRIQRTVKIRESDGTYGSFNTRFACRLSDSASTRLADFEFFVPAHWYKDNKHLPPNALAADYANPQILIREDRIPLPVAMVRNPETGHTAAMIVENRNPAATLRDQGLPRVVDAGMAFGSLGFTRDDSLNMVFYYPGSEGVRTFIQRQGGPKGPNKTWALRSDPAKQGHSQSYTLCLIASSTDSFAAAMKASWRTAYDLYDPPLYRADLKRIWADGIDLFRRYFRQVGAAAGVPFALTLPQGQPKSWELGMGFVGQQLFVGYLLMEQGLRAGDTDLTAKGEAIVDFWANRSLLPSGMPRTSFVLDKTPALRGVLSADGMPVPTAFDAEGWRWGGSSLRSIGDGMNGILAAHDLMSRRQIEKPAWRACLVGVGDWLARVQNPDGSWFRRYGQQGAVLDDCPYTTPNVVPFLAGLYRLTGEERYRQAALRAGDYMWKEIHAPFIYAGSVVDNLTGVDRESGMIAMGAFLALHDLTGEQRWLDGACQAADYVETWAYFRHIPQVAGAKAAVFPKTRTTIGLSAIATGHSGVDTFFSATAFDYCRLYLDSHDSHYLSVAKQAYYNTKQAMDWDGTLGYAYPALCSEAGIIGGPGPMRGAGFSVWLPWITVTQTLPIVRLQQAFGASDPDEFEQTHFAVEKQSMHERYSKTEGLSSGNGGR
ncbi:MAG: hypothetical protein NTW86_03265 [Candidatus Sumerlaeota bacterium]|nr:hypothetical protein [Candidatus Sumerlaeota bacterium]